MTSYPAQQGKRISSGSLSAARPLRSGCIQDQHHSLRPKANGIAHLCGGTVTLLNTIAIPGKKSFGVCTPTWWSTSKAGCSSRKMARVWLKSMRCRSQRFALRQIWCLWALMVGSTSAGPPARVGSETRFARIRGLAGMCAQPDVVDWNGDGIQDVLTNRTDGTLRLHRGLPAGGFLPPTILASSGSRGSVDLTVGMWGTVRSVIAADASGLLKAWPILSSGALGSPATIGSGWKGRKMVLMVPSRSSTAALIVNQAGSLYRYSRTAGGNVSTSPVRLSTGGFATMTAFTPVYAHRPGFNGIAWLDSAGSVRYTDVAPSSVGKNVDYAFLLKSHKLAST